MTQDSGRDEFEGIDINGPWGGIRIGGRGMGRSWDDWGDDDDDVRRIRRHVRRKLDFYRHLVFYVCIVGVAILLDWATGEGAGWSLWFAGIWGVFVLMQFVSTFLAPMIWGREAEERMVRQEVERSRGRVHVTRAPVPTEPPTPRGAEPEQP